MVVAKKLLSDLKSVPWSLSKCKVPCSLKIFGLEFEKTVALSEMSSLEFVKMKTFIQNKKLCVWDKKYLILVVLGNNLKKLVISNHLFQICENAPFLAKKNWREDCFIRVFLD